MITKIFLFLIWCYSAMILWVIFCDGFWTLRGQYRSKYAKVYGKRYAIREIIHDVFEDKRFISVMLIDSGYTLIGICFFFMWIRS